MPLGQVPAQDVESVRAAIVVIIVGVMFFWKIMFRMMLAIIVIAAVLGLFVLLQNIQR